MLTLISRSPIFGYGVFGMWRYSALPHNFFLEILIQGGTVYFSFILIFLTYVFIKLYKITRIDPSFKLISILGLYPLVFLMFSGSYMSNSIFWFCISFVISYSSQSLNQGIKLSNEDHNNAEGWRKEGDKYDGDRIYN